MTAYRQVLYVLVYRDEVVSPPYPFYKAEEVARRIEQDVQYLPGRSFITIVRYDGAMEYLLQGSVNQ